MKYKCVGTLCKKIAEDCNLYEHIDKKILVYNDRIEHVIEKHLKDFGDLNNLMKVYYSIPSIIKNPDYCFYNKKTNGLEYYKYIEKNLCVVVRINNGSVLKVRSWYPANKGKINNRKRLNKIELKV